MPGNHFGLFAEQPAVKLADCRPFLEGFAVERFARRLVGPRRQKGNDFRFVFPDRWQPAIHRHLDPGRPGTDNHESELGLGHLVADEGDLLKALYDAVAHALGRGQDQKIVVAAQVARVIAEARARMALQDYSQGERLLGETELRLKHSPSAELKADVMLAYSSLSNNLGKHELSLEYADRGLAERAPSVGEEWDVEAGQLPHALEAVKKLIAQVIAVCRQRGRKIGICGQAPSDYPEFAAFLVGLGIDSISLNPDSVVTVKKRVAAMEREMAGK